MICDSCGTTDLRDFGHNHETCVECKKTLYDIKDAERNGYSSENYKWMLDLRRQNVKINKERK